MNVLITSASRKVGLVRAFMEAARSTGGGRVVAADITPLAPALYEADAGILIPRSDDPGFVDAVLAVCEHDEIGLLVPTRDEELPVFAAAKERFAASGVSVLVADADAVETCQDKRRFAVACVAAGLTTPRVIESPTPADLPLFIRPRRGKGGMGARAVRSEAELHVALAELGGEAFSQELVIAPEYTIDVFVDSSGVPISSVPRRRLLVVAGESYVGRTVRHEPLQQATLRLVTALRLTGHLTVQAFDRDGEILFIEVNPRYGGGAALGFAAGARSPESAIRQARGERLVPHLDDYAVDLTMLRYTDDRFLGTADLIDAGGGQ
jgi:carbamoyl-phosphate synthase large subunit